MIICPRALDTIVPLETASMPGRVVVQWDKDDCEDLGIIKVDLLGLGMMAVLQDTLATCAPRGRAAVDLHRIPQDDPATYDDDAARGHHRRLPDREPRADGHAAAHEAGVLLRSGRSKSRSSGPAPSSATWCNPYLEPAQRQGTGRLHRRPASSPCWSARSACRLFQEQVLKMAMIMADFTGSEAEELRRALSFHRSAGAHEQACCAKLRAAMRAQGRAGRHRRSASSAPSGVFALYGFPESHAISFALLAYASAWLKVPPRPPSSTAALLNNQPMGFYSRATLMHDAKHHGVRVRPVCVAQSDLACTIEDDTTLRLGLNQLQGVSRASLEWIIREKAQHPWRNLDDFLLRCQLPRDERQVLASAGALNALGHHRRSALWEVGERRTADLFTSLGVREDPAPGGAILPAMTPQERLEADYRNLSLTTGPHPMAYERHRVPHLLRASDLAGRRHGDHVTIGGLVICRQRPGTAKGHVFVSLEDETGIANAFVPSSLFEKRRLIITQEPFLQIHGRLQIADNVVTVCARRVDALRCHAELKGRSHDFH